MSYSYSLTSSKSELDGQHEREAKAKTSDTGDPDAADAVADHTAAVRRAVAELAAVVGPADGDVSVSVSGHANPEHGEREGWARESITITVAHQAGEPST